MSARQTIERHPRLLLWSAVLAFVLCHLYKLGAPPNGYHAWRESDTAAIVLNYYEEDANPLHPRVNQRGDTSGITGMELPLYHYSAAVLYMIFGPHHWLARGLTLLCGCMAVLLCFMIVGALFDETTAVLTAWAMAFSPLFFFYSFKIMPDVTMLALFLGSVLLYLRYVKDGSLAAWVGSLVLLVLSAAIKPLVLSVLLLWVVIWSREQRARGGVALKLVLYVVVAVAAPVAWFAYARHVNLTHGSPGFYLGENLANFHQFLFAAQFFKKLFLQWPWELWIGWAMVPAFALGVWKLWTRARRRLFIGTWILAVYIVFALTAQHSASHDYYTLVALPPLALVTGLGLRMLLEGSAWRRALLVLLLVAAPVGAWLRVGHRFTDESQFGEIRQAADRTIPPQALVMVEDPTTAVRLYQLNRHGWPLRFAITYDTVRTRIEKGADYLVLTKPLDSYQDSLSLLVASAPVRLGPLYAYRVEETR